ncbi:hypothetical protein HNY73_003920 [Argiope bruennichi]|uniref:Uncharacterized protein n=1 Tax=Argiope bruennichi TaxID=94029 RepID=A0A8T0FN19_ARGBR|nr:hypothetical protein HNY73_003920 [Argiope bruennichi]
MKNADLLIIDGGDISSRGGRFEGADMQFELRLRVSKCGRGLLAKQTEGGADDMLKDGRRTTMVTSILTSGWTPSFPLRY